MCSSFSFQLQEAALTAVASIALSSKRHFTKYYDTFVPGVKSILSSAKGKSMATLRGKAIECISLIGRAVGPEKFRPDCKLAPLPPCHNANAQKRLRENHACKRSPPDFASAAAQGVSASFASSKVARPCVRSTTAGAIRYLCAQGRGCPKTARAHLCLRPGIQVPRARQEW